MNLTKLRSNQIQLIEFMKKGGYSDYYIRKTEYEIEQLLEFGKDFKDYLEYYQKYICHKTSNITTQKEKKVILTLIMNFDLYGKYPDRNKCKNKIIDNSRYSKLNPYFKNIIDTYKKEVSEKMKESTIHTTSLNCSCFLFHLQSKNYKNLLDVEEKDIINFFLDNNGKLKYSRTYTNCIKSVLKECIPYIEGSAKIIDLLPKIRNVRKNIQYLTQDEIDRIKEVLENDSSISLRDKAIVTMALYTGLRGCDIANLKLSNINWENDSINIVQQKTGVNLELPLTTTVGNALYEYISNERPNNANFDNVFIRKEALFPIGKTTTNTAVKIIFKKANIRQGKNQQKGTHIFRHNLATSLLKNEVPREIITHILGHLEPNSLNTYLNADFYNLKKCALSIKIFENIKEAK